MENLKICVVGLGYVGLPLAVAFGRKTGVIGFDVNRQRINELKQGIDKTKEVSNEELAGVEIEFTNDPVQIKNATFVIVAVPTPIDESKRPDLKYLESASEIVGKNLNKGAIVVYESTVYPGVTEDVCLPILERESGMKLGEFKIGYSPERINPGDKEHTISKIIKIVSGCDKETCEKVAEIYSMVIEAGVFKAADIKTAEAAKVIENVQRDLNIALMNELSLIFGKMNINTKDVLEAAGTKWSFHNYYPGLVGGHCIGVDPYYLTYKSQELGYHPRVILAGREINDGMAEVVGKKVINGLKNSGKEIKDCNVLVMGLTFKENVPDLRNSKAKDVISFLKYFNINVIACEPLISYGVVNGFNVENKKFDGINDIDCVVFINNHREFENISLDDLKNKMDKPFLVDVKGFYDKKKADLLGFDYKTL